MFAVREKSLSERLEVKRLNSGSSLYCGSSCRRQLVGCDSSAEESLKDIASLEMRARWSRRLSDLGFGGSRYRVSPEVKGYLETDGNGNQRALDAYR